MKKLLVLLLSSALYGQVAQYPGAVVTDSQLMVAKNLLTTKLVTALAPTDTSLVVASNVGFTANMLVTVDVEIIKISGIVGSNVLTVDALGRGFDGSTAIAHPIGKQVSVFLDAWHHMAVTAELKAIEQTLGNNMSNVPGSPSGGNVPVNKGGTGASTGPNALTALGVVYPTPVGQGGTGVGLAQGSGTKVQLSSGATTPNDCVKFDATGNTIDSGLPCNTQPAASAQLQNLRIKPNTGNISTTEFADPAIVNVKDYNYPAQTPGGTLTAAVGASVTVTPCPLGVLGTDTRLRFWIANGTGTAESVASTGAGTCTSGGTTGTVTFTPANTHTGAWTLSSSHQGIYEAMAANPFRKVYIPAGVYMMHDCITLPSTGGTWITADNYDSAYAGGSILNYSTVNNSCGSAIQTLAGGNLSTFQIENIQLWGPNAIVTGAPLAGLAFKNSVRVTLSHVGVSGFYYGVLTDGAFEVTIDRKSLINYNSCRGLYAVGLTNLLRVSDSYFDYNGRISGGGCGPGIEIAAGVPVVLDGIESAGNGTAPYAGQTITFAPGLVVSNTSSFNLTNSYIEANVGPAQVQYGPLMSSITETNNQCYPALASSTSCFNYAVDTTAVHSFGNTFWGPTAVRVFANPNLSTYQIGPDTCLAGSTECTVHPQMSGLPTLASFTFATLPVKPNGTQLYCSDCNATCSAGASTGRTCFREAGIWIR